MNSIIRRSEGSNPSGVTPWLPNNTINLGDCETESKVIEILEVQVLLCQSNARVSEEGAV